MMFEKYYVPVPLHIAAKAAEYFQGQSQLGLMDIEIGVFRQLMTFCSEIILLNEARIDNNQDKIDVMMTNTHAVWVYTNHKLWKEYVLNENSAP